MCCLLKPSLTQQKQLMKLLLAIALLVLVPVQWENACVSGSEWRCREEERLALLSINASLSFPFNSFGGNWEGKECCRWDRVTCDPITGHITGLDLGISYYDDMTVYYTLLDYSLNATLFLPLRHLRSLSLSGQGIGFITGLETWMNLTKLETLKLFKNNLDGRIINDLASVSSLRTLDLSRNYINFSLPINNGFESWSNLTKLQILDLSRNDLPKGIMTSLAKVSSLRTLYLDVNPMGDNVPLKELISTALNIEAVSLIACGLNGSFPDLGHSSSLKALSFADNELNDTLSLEGLCRLKNLEQLDLSGNEFTGNLPPCMGNLSSLQLLDLSSNHLQINFPTYIFQRLMSLTYLSLSNNKIEGTLSMRSFWNHSNLEVLQLSTSALNFRVEVVDLPFQLQVLELANCNLKVERTFLYSQHKLRVLDLSNTGSRGHVSVVWLLENNTNLITLNLHKNYFTGPLHLPSLTHEKLSILDISDNHLSGELPANISIRLPNLISLDLSKNYFHGPLPLISISSLHVLDLSFNSLADDIHKTFAWILPHLSSLDLSNNQFYGSVTNHLNFTRAPQLLFGDNNISGEIPSSICNSSFAMLDISNNKLNGILPDCIGRAEISVLKLNGNYLRGSLPLEMCAGRSLLWLDLSNNKLSGSIPPCYNQSALEIVDLSQNNLTGNFPITWLNISDIYAINIGENHLSGKLPIWIGKESTLRMLQARQNLLEGPIPKQSCQLKNLRILDLSHNNLSGQIPSCIIDIGSADREFNGWFVDQLYQSVLWNLNYTHANFLLRIFTYDFIEVQKSPNFGLELVSKGRLDFYLEQILSIQCIIDLSSNKLDGTIPGDIGRMNWLITLDLSNNHLSGVIPNSISKLYQLESLDLSHNSFTGEIPRELIELTSIESFSVAYNDLSGPTLGVEGQFISFDKRSYEGNPNLCGFPLSKSCIPTLGTSQPSPNEINDDERYKSIDFLILFGSFSLFFVVSFWCFMVVLYFKRNWRYALFTLVDWFGDMIYVEVVRIGRRN